MKILLIVLTVIFTSSAYAGGKRKTHPTINNTTEIINNYSVTGVSAAIAMSAINFDMSTRGVQIGAGASYFESANGRNENAAAIGIGSRVCLSQTSCGIINSSVSVDTRGAKAVSAGVTWAL